MLVSFKILPLLDFLTASTTVAGRISSLEFSVSFSLLALLLLVREALGWLIVKSEKSHQLNELSNLITSLIDARLEQKQSLKIVLVGLGSC